MVAGEQLARCRAAWYVPPPERGGGGFRTILQNAQALAEHGFTNDFYVVPTQGSAVDLAKIRNDCPQWFGMAPDRWFIAGSDEAERDIAITTAWNSVAWADALPCRAIFYFVQDYEPWFMPLNADRLEAEASYQKGFVHITLGRWLATRISADTPGELCAYMDFGVSPLYTLSEAEGACRESRSVCAIYQPEKDRRVATLLTKAIKVTLALDPNLKFYLYGSGEKAPIESDRVISLGIITPEQCAELYHRCTCGVSLSTSNPSRIPFEMMSCGLPVIDLYRTSNLYDFENGCIRLTEPNPAALGAAIADLVADAQLQERMRNSALLMMQTRTLENESRSFVNFVEEYLATNSCNVSLPTQSYTDPAYTANEQAEAIWREQLLAEHKQLHDMSIPLCCKRGGLHIRIDTDKVYEGLRVACWSQPDQSDIQWLNFSYADGSYVVDVPIDESQVCRGVETLHFYRREHDHDVCIGMLTVPVSFSDDYSRDHAIFEAFHERIAIREYLAFTADAHPLPVPKSHPQAWFSLLRARKTPELKHEPGGGASCSAERGSTRYGSR